MQRLISVEEVSTLVYQGHRVDSPTLGHVSNAWQDNVGAAFRLVTWADKELRPSVAVLSGLRLNLLTRDKELARLFPGSATPRERGNVAVWCPMQFHKQCPPHET